MKSNRIFLFVICIILLFSSCGCQKSQSAKVLTENDLIGQDGCYLYTIVSAEADSTDDDIKKETGNLKKQLTETFDIKVNTGTDKKIKANDANYEILIGNTTRKESKSALKLLTEKRIQNVDDWMIKVIDKKICIVSVSESNLAKAIRYFNVNYCTKLSDFAKLKDGFEYSYSKEYEVKDATGVAIGGTPINKFVIVTSREKSYLYSKKLLEFADIFKEKYGIEIKSVLDTEEESQYEIIVGNTGRAISAENTPKNEDYVIALIGDKLVINGGNDIATAYGVQRILDMESEARNSGTAFKIDKDFKEAGTAVLKENEYHFSWSDEFNGSLDRTVWGDQIGGDSSAPSPNGGTTYIRGSKNAFTRDGCLVLPSKRLNDTDFERTGIMTRRSFAFRYGVIEFRAKLAPPPMCSSFVGYPPDFLINNGKRQEMPSIKNYMELDIYENFGQTDWLASNLHHWWTDGSLHTSLDGTKYAEQKKYYFPEGAEWYNSFHIFSTEWTPYGVTYSIDGEPYFEYDMSQIEDVGFAQIPIDLAMAGGYSTASYYLQKKIPDDAPKYGEYLIDYIRVYQNDKYDNILMFDPVKD